MLKYYMGEPSAEADFDEVHPKKICIYSKPIYIPKLELDVYGHIECEKPLNPLQILSCSLVEEPRNHLAYQMIMTRGVKGPWKK